MRDLVQRFTEDPDWLPSVSRDITEAIHAELPDVDADPELRSSTYASTGSVLRLLADLSQSSLPPQEAAPPPAAVDYAREFVRRGLPLDSLLRAYHIGQAVFFARRSEKAHADIPDQGDVAEAIELGAKWTFDFVEALSGGLVRRYAEERERWVRSAAALRAQVVDSLLSGESVDVEASSRRLGYEHWLATTRHSSCGATNGPTAANRCWRCSNARRSRSCAHSAPPGRSWWHGPGCALAAGSAGAASGRSTSNQFSSTARLSPTCSPASVHPGTGSRASAAATAKLCTRDALRN